MAWLTHGECHVELKNQKYDNDKIRIMCGILQCFDSIKISSKEGVLLHESDDGIFQVINLERIVLAFDFCCKYLDHISEDLEKDEKTLEHAVKIAKENLKSEFSQRDLNRQLKREVEKNSKRK